MKICSEPLHQWDEFSKTLKNGPLKIKFLTTWTRLQNYEKQFRGCFAKDHFSIQRIHIYCQLHIFDLGLHNQLDVCIIWLFVFSKSSYFWNVFLVSSILPKNERKQFDLRYHSSKVKFFCSLFGRIEDTKKTFRN